MFAKARVRLLADRWTAYSRIVRFVGVDFTGADFAMQVRTSRDQVPAPSALANLSKVTTVGAEGVRFVGVTTADGVPTSELHIVIAKATMAAMDVAADSGLAGSDGTAFYDLVIAPTNAAAFVAMAGEFVIEAGSTQSALTGGTGPGGITVIEIADNGVTVVLSGSQLAGQFANEAEEARDAARAWAESPDAPGGEGTKSSKSWATEAGESAAAAADVLTDPAFVTVFGVADEINALGPRASDLEALAPYAPNLASVPTPAEGPDQFGIVGNDGYWLFRLTPTFIQHPQIDQIARQAAKVETQAAVEAPDALAQAGSDGYFDWRVTENDIIHPAFKRLKHRALVDTNSDTALWDMATLAERIGLILIGQSNAAGNSGTPPISTTGSAYADMFNGGAVPEALVYNVANVNSNRASLTPLLESTRTGNAAIDGGETSLSGCVEMIVQMLRDEDGLDLLNIGQKFIASAEGHGGSGIAGMLQANGSTFVYERYAASMNQGAALSNAAGRSYVPGAMMMIQGETDNSNDDGTSNVYGSGQSMFDYYTQRLNTWQEQAQAISNAILGYNRRLPFAILQTVTHPVHSKPRPNVALAQLQACIDNPEFLFAGPGYVAPMATAGAQLHYGNVGHKWNGALFGYVLKRLLFDQVKMAPLVPTFTAQGNQIIGRFPVDADKRILGGVRPGVANTDLTVLSNWGVTAVAADGTTAKALTNPRVGGRDLIIWDAPETPVDPWKIRCAWSGDVRKGWTNIAESDPIIFDPNGLRLPVQRWVPICEVTLT